MSAPAIIAGFGGRAEAGADSYHAALTACLAQHTVRPTALATLPGKTDALAPVAEALSLPLITVATDELRAQTTLTHSSAAQAAHGTGSVAEAAALAAAGPGAKLLGPRIVSPDRRATCALATQGSP